MVHDSARLPSDHDGAPLDLHDKWGPRADASVGAEADSCTNAIRKYKPEQIIAVLRQIEVQIANGKTPPQACKEAEIYAQAAG